MSEEVIGFYKNFLNTIDRNPSKVQLKFLFELMSHQLTHPEQVAVGMWLSDLSSILPGVENLSRFTLVYAIAWFRKVYAIFPSESFQKLVIVRIFKSYLKNIMINVDNRMLCFDSWHL